MAVYSLIRDFISDTDPSKAGLYDMKGQTAGDLLDHLDVSPDWLIAVIRWKNSVTFSRDIMFSSTNIDNSNLSDVLDILIIHSGISNMQVDGSKESFTPSLSAALLPNRDYLRDILPDDWVFAWMVNSEADGADLEERIRSRKPCNLFSDGLKFVGRVNSLREVISATEEGVKTLRYNLNCSAFKELNSQIFYNQYLAQNFQFISEYMSALGTSLNKIIDADGGGIDSNRIIPELIELLLGRGVSQQFASPGGTDIAAGGVSSSQGTSQEAPYAYVVPSEVAALLGQTKSGRQSGVFSFADILDSVVGVQRFRGTSGESGGPEAVFTPDGVGFGGYSGNRNTTGYLLLGTFLPQSVSFTDNSVWTILHQFLNPAVNEMYVGLRVNKHGSVMPTLTVRQLPFTTAIGAVRAPANLNVTPFLEVPRWHVHDILIRSIERGRSSALRFNFILITGQDIMMQANNSPTEQVVRNPPLRDDMDAKRNGLHPYMMNVACSHQDTFGNSLTPWITIISDFLINQELTLTGTFMLVGIQAPIAVGDNLEYNGVVYHIENVSHSCSISPAGKKRFSTTLAVSHGVLAEPNIDSQDTIPTPTVGVPQTGHNDAAMFYGMREIEGTGTVSTADGAPAITVELSSGKDPNDPEAA